MTPPAGTSLELEIELAISTSQRLRPGRPAIGRPDLDDLAEAAGDALMAPSSWSLIVAVRRTRTGRGYAGMILEDAAIVRLVVTERWSPKPGGCRIMLRDAA